MSGFVFRSTVTEKPGLRARRTRHIIIHALTSHCWAYGMPRISEPVSSFWASASSRGQRNCCASRSDQPVPGLMSCRAVNSLGVIGALVPWWAASSVMSHGTRHSFAARWIGSVP